MRFNPVLMQDEYWIYVENRTGNYVAAHSPRCLVVFENEIDGEEFKSEYFQLMISTHKKVTKDELLEIVKQYPGGYVIYDVYDMLLLAEP